MKFSITKGICKDLFFSSGYSLKSAKKDLVSNNPFFSAFWSIQKLPNFSQNYAANRRLKVCLTKTEKSITRILPTHAAMPCVLKRNMALAVFEIYPPFCKIILFFSKTTWPKVFCD